MSKNKYYVVKAGHKSGIYNSWADCKLQVDGYSGAIYKSFTSKKEAEDFLGQTTLMKPKKEDMKTIIAYIDGSFNEKIDLFSCGVLIIDNDKKIELKASSTDSNLVDMRNVAGELMGVEILINWTKKNIVENVNLKVHYDYAGIEHWANNEWKANKVGTRAYKKMIENFRLENNAIEFIKVKAHSGDENNEIADKLAGEAGVDFTYLVSSVLDISKEVDSNHLIHDKELPLSVTKKEVSKYDELFRETMKSGINDKGKFTINTSNLVINEKLILKFIKACWKFDGKKIKDIRSISIKLDTDQKVLNWEINTEEQLYFSYNY